LNGNEDDLELEHLAKDIFQFFGLGCRNVSKIYIPEDYDFSRLLSKWDSNNALNMHSKYKNNFDYNYALYLLNKDSFLHNSCIILKEDSSFTSRISTIHYEQYSDLAQVERSLVTDQKRIQCVVSREGLLRNIKTVPFGQSQNTNLNDYADGIDTMTFLSKL
jgi:hypothetical protein